LNLITIANGPCLGYRENGTGPYLWLTYADVIEKTRFIGSGLLNKQIKADASTNIGIYSRNRMEVCLIQLDNK
jgi:long-subunit acyl-CoA synthetase (AMP-forming)